MDHKEVIVGTETVDQVQISGLDDRTLSPEGKASLDNVCVYSSTGWASLLFDGSNTAPGKGKFQLRQTSTADHAIPYEIEINSSYRQSAVIGKYGYAQHRGGNRWQVRKIGVRSFIVHNQCRLLERPRNSETRAGCQVLLLEHPFPPLRSF